MNDTSRLAPGRPSRSDRACTLHNLALDPSRRGNYRRSGPRLAVFCRYCYVRGRGRRQCCGHAARQLDAPPPGCSDIQHRWTSRAWLSRTSPNRETVRRPEIAQHMDRYKSGPLAFPPRASRILASFFCQFAGHLLVRPFSEIGLRLASPFPPNIFMRLRAGNRHRPPNQT